MLSWQTSGSTDKIKRRNVHSGLISVHRIIGEYCRRRVKIVYTEDYAEPSLSIKTGTLKETLFRGTWSCIYATDVITTWGGSFSVDSWTDFIMVESAKKKERKKSKVRRKKSVKKAKAQRKRAQKSKSAKKKECKKAKTWRKKSEKKRNRKEKRARKMPGARELKCKSVKFKA